MKLTGTGVALVTPFDKELNIDYPALEALINHVSKGVEYLVVQGTTGESPTTSDSEKKEILKFVLEHNTKKLPIVYGIGGNNTKSILEQIQNTNLDSVDALLSVSPYYNKPSQQSLIYHYEEIANTSPKPIILYNVPGRTGSNISAETTLRLSKHPNIIGIKEASGNMEQITQIALNKSEDFYLISGDDMLTIPMISLGSIGVISVIANAYPVIFGDLIRAALNGDFKSNLRNYSLLNDINSYLYQESNPVGIKCVLEEMGIMNSVCRPPLYQATDSLKSILKNLDKKIRS